MKKTLLLVAAGLMLITATQGQKAEIGGFYGIAFNGKIRTYYGEFQIDNKANYGGHLSIALAPETFIEFLYNRTDTKVQYFDRGGASRPFDLGIEYYHVGGLQQVDIGSDRIAPFGVFTLGATRFNIKDPVEFNDGNTSQTISGDTYTFSIALAGGAKIFLAERIGIRLQARLGMPMLFNGVYLGVGTGGASGGLSFHVPTVMFDLSAGVFIRI